MPILDLSKHCDDPSLLFLRLWLQANGWTSSQRTNSVSPLLSVQKQIEAALEENSGEIVCKQLCSIIASSSNEFPSFVGTLLFVMKSIDYQFIRIHPRSLGTRFGIPPALPSWLENSKTQRLLSGAYCSLDNLIAVPRGPLCSQPRQESESGGERLDDRFAALTVASASIEDRGKTSKIAIKIAAQDDVSGIGRLRNVGTERVGFVPVAEKKGELLAIQRDRPSRSFVEFRPADHLNPSARLYGVAATLKDIDIILAPELIMPESEADGFVRIAKGKPSLDAKLVVLGSGATVEQENGQSYNESRVVNSYGNELWRQRKIWPSFLDQRRAKACSLTDPGDKGQVYEDNASGSQVIVFDADGFGRCVVLICQDLWENDYATQAVSQYQPDWIFAPVLDFEAGLDAGRWVHQRVFELSGLANTRFLVANSTSLAEFVGKLDTCFCGLAVGPKSQARKFLNVKTSSTSPSFASLIWGSSGWHQTTLTSK